MKMSPFSPITLLVESILHYFVNIGFILKVVSKERTFFFNFFMYRCTGKNGKETDFSE